MKDVLGHDTLVNNCKDWYDEVTGIKINEFYELSADRPFS